MSDLFQEAVPDDFIHRVFEVMAAANWHTYQVLTKRAERMETVVSYLPGRLQRLSNVWLGVSVEDRKYGFPRIEHLRRTPAGVRFLSVEPLLESLGPIKLTHIDWVIVARAVRELVPWLWNGSRIFVTAASLGKFHSSSSNGAAFESHQQAAFSTEGRTTNTRGKPS